jgi:hypothetical protein
MRTEYGRKPLILAPEEDSLFRLGRNQFLPAGV